MIAGHGLTITDAMGKCNESCFLLRNAVLIKPNVHERSLHSALKSLEKSRWLPHLT